MLRHLSRLLLHLLRHAELHLTMVWIHLSRLLLRNARVRRHHRGLLLHGHWVHHHRGRAALNKHVRALVDDLLLHHLDTVALRSEMLLGLLVKRWNLLWWCLNVSLHVRICVRYSHHLCMLRNLSRVTGVWLLSHWVAIYFLSSHRYLLHWINLLPKWYPWSYLRKHRLVQRWRRIWGHSIQKQEGHYCFWLWLCTLVIFTLVHQRTRYIASRSLSKLGSELVAMSIADLVHRDIVLRLLRSKETLLSSFAQ